MNFNFSRLALAAGVLALASSAPALTVSVDPVAGTDNGSSPFLTIEAAVAAITGADAGADTINLLDGVHTLGSTVEFQLFVLAADGDLTIQTDAGASAPATIELGNVTGRKGSIDVDGGSTLTFNNLIFIQNNLATDGANVGDGFQFFNNTSQASATPAAIINFNDVVFAANNGSDGPVSFDFDVELAGIQPVGDDWIDFFPNIQANLDNVIVSGSLDDAIINRGSATAGDRGSELNITGRSIISAGGRGIQNVFSLSGDATTEPVVNATGTPSERILFTRCGQSLNDETAAVVLFGGVLNADYVDFINNDGRAFRIDADTGDGFALSNCRVAFNGQGASNFPGIDFRFATADLSLATITDCTIHDNAGTSLINFETGATGTVVTFTDTIISGSGDTIDIADAGENTNVDFIGSAIVTAGPNALGGTGGFSGGTADATSTFITADPDYQSTVYDVNDPENAAFLRVRNTAFSAADSGGGPLLGGNPTPIPPATVGTWDQYTY